MASRKGKSSGKETRTKNGASLGFEPTMWLAADKLRGNMDAAEYKHVVLGLIFLKYISDAFQEHFEKLKAEPHADPEDRDEYTAENIFWVPKAARWPYLQGHAKQATIGKLLDDAMAAIEKENPILKGVLPKDYARESLDKYRLGELIDLIGTIGLGDKESRSKDILGRVYEYFLGEFARAEGKKGGQFYTARCVDGRALVRGPSALWDGGFEHGQCRGRLWVGPPHYGLHLHVQRVGSAHGRVEGFWCTTQGPDVAFDRSLDRLPRRSRRPTSLELSERGADVICGTGSVK
jgi:hypothetical protein